MSAFKRPSAYGGCVFKPVARRANLWPIEYPKVAGSALYCRTGRCPLRCSLTDGNSVRALMAPAWAGKTPGPQLALLWVFCRIDYLLATPGVTALARREHVYLEQRFSGHAPLTIDRLRLQALTCRRAIGPGDGGRQGW